MSLELAGLTSYSSRIAARIQGAVRDVVLGNPVLALLKRIIADFGSEAAWRYGAAFLCMAIVSGCTALSAWMMKDMINKIFVDRDQIALLWIPVAIFLLFTVKGGASYLQEVMLSIIGNRVLAAVQKRLYAKFLRMDVAFFQRNQSNDLITRITYNAGAVRDMLNIVTLGVGRDLMTVTGLVIVMMTQDLVLSAFALVGGPLCAIGVRRLIGLVRAAARSEIASMAEVIAITRETSQGIRVVKAFQLESELERKLAEAVNSVERLNVRMTKVQARVSPLVETLGGIVIALVVLYAGWRNLTFGDTPGQFFAFITALLLAADPAKRLAKARLQLAMAAEGARMIYDVLDMPEPEPLGSVNAILKPTSASISFSAVSFGYDPSRPVLKNLNVHFAGGKKHALVGLSGSGKTTIFNLIQRFWIAQHGEITIDGQSITSCSLPSLRKAISLVSQDAFLFEGSVRDNIGAGTSATDEEIEAAARAAHADEFVRSLEYGYSTKVGELGSHLSGGQRQRISLARAFLRDSPIVLLDEPTASLDSETEAAIQVATEKLLRGRTSITIAHRLATVLNADVIHVIEAGTVAEVGTHAELLQRGGLYSRLYDLQFGPPLISEPKAQPAQFAGMELQPVR